MEVLISEGGVLVLEINNARVAYHHTWSFLNMQLGSVSLSEGLLCNKQSEQLLHSDEPECSVDQGTPMATVWSS